MAREKSEKVDKISDNEKTIMSLFGGEEQSVFLNGDINCVANMDVISTGSSTLDYALGVGGIPRGRIIQLAGKESSGKTLLSFMIVKSWLDKDPENTAMFIDAEYTYDPKWVKQLGVDTSRVIVVRINEAKKIFDGLLGKMKENKITKKVTKGVNGVLDLVIEGQEKKFKKLGVIIVDSLAAINTPMEIAAEVGKQNMSPISRFLSTELKKLTPAVAKANVAMIFINQVRVNIGQMHGDPETTSGGKALKHACSVMIQTAASQSKDNSIFDKNENMIGHTVNVKVTKNKVGPPFRKAKYKIEYNKGIVNKAEELLDIACALNIIERPNLRSYIYGEEKLTSREQAIDFLSIQSNYDEIEKKCRDLYLSGAEAKIEVEEEDDSDDMNDFISTEQDSESEEESE